MNSSQARSEMEVAFQAALAAIEPRALVQRGLAAEKDLSLADLACGVVAVGKAAAAMCWGAHDALGSAIVSGVAVGASLTEVPSGIDWYTGDHPVPGAGSLEAGEAVLRYLRSTDVDFVIFLISGGGSALIEVPPPGVSLSQLAAIQEQVLKRDVPIEQLNLVRRSMSMVKNGGLLAATRVPSATFLISDVGDSGAGVIASGPTITSPYDPAAAVTILQSAGITVDPALEQWMNHSPTVTGETRWTVLADGWTAARAAARSLADSGTAVSMPRRPFRGEARRVGPAMAAQAQAGYTVAPGETTVTVTGTGFGGRNTEAALATAVAIEGRTDVVFGAFATDGSDGTTGAAGAIVDGGSASRMRVAGVHPLGALEQNDSYPALTASGDVVTTGATGTNVADLWMVWAANSFN